MCDEIDSKLKWVNKLILYHGHVARKIILCYPRLYDFRIRSYVLI